MRCTLRSLSRLMTFLPNLLRIFRSLRYLCHFFFSSRRRHTRLTCDWSSDVCSSDLIVPEPVAAPLPELVGSEDSEVLRLNAGHVGLVVGRTAAKVTIPRIIEFLEARSERLSPA